jgi:hypothetical protein
LYQLNNISCYNIGKIIFSGGLLSKPAAPRFPSSATSLTTIYCASVARITFPEFGMTDGGALHLDQAGEFIVSIPVGQGLAHLVAHGSTHLELLSPRTTPGKCRSSCFLSVRQPQRIYQGFPGLRENGAWGQGNADCRGLYHDSRGDSGGNRPPPSWQGGHRNPSGEGKESNFFGRFPNAKTS